MRTARARRAALVVALAAAAAVASTGPVSAAPVGTAASAQTAARPAPPPAALPPAEPKAACSALGGVQIPARALGLPTSGASVTAAVDVPSSGTGPTAVAEHCRVSVSIRPVDPTAPEIRMQVALPDSWARRTVMLGGGGYNGTIPALTSNVPFGPADAPTPLGRGYVVYASDSGHQAVPGKALTPSLEGSFLANDEALRNFAGDALKKTHDAAQLLVQRYYRTAPQQQYFAGGSTGGREALAVAQRFPADFDGVISVYPAFNAAALDLFFGHITRQLAVPGAFPRPAQQVLLYDAVMQACDGLDGAVDGVVGDEASCSFDPDVLRCPAGAEGADTCLSAVQIAAIRAISGPISFPYPLASRETGYPGFPFLSGADMTTPVLGLGTTAPADPMPRTAGYGSQFWDQWVKYAVTRDPSFSSLALDPLAPGRYQQRISELTDLQDVNRSNLRPFVRRGGKLLLLHGTADELVSHRSTIDYYNRLLDRMGARAVRSSVRFYLVPGANHANLQAAFAAGWDSLTALDRWVSTGQAPVDPVVSDVRPGVTRTRPLCQYPTTPVYAGTGEVDLASSWSCVRSEALAATAQTIRFGGR